MFLRKLGRKKTNTHTDGVALVETESGRNEQAQEGKQFEDKSPCVCRWTTIGYTPYMKNKAPYQLWSHYRLTEKKLLKNHVLQTTTMEQTTKEHNPPRNKKLKGVAIPSVIPSFSVLLAILSS